jgi:hypothetical protein
MGLVALELAALNDLLAARPTDEVAVEQSVRQLLEFEIGEKVWVRARIESVDPDIDGEIRLRTIDGGSHPFWMKPGTEARQ